MWRGVLIFEVWLYYIVSLETTYYKTTPVQRYCKVHRPCVYTIRSTALHALSLREASTARGKGGRGPKLVLTGLVPQEIPSGDETTVARTWVHVSSPEAGLQMYPLTDCARLLGNSGNSRTSMCT